jgi:hypothetical protein
MEKPTEKKFTILACSAPYSVHTAANPIFLIQHQSGVKPGKTEASLASRLVYGAACRPRLWHPADGWRGSHGWCHGANNSRVLEVWCNSHRQPFNQLVSAAAHHYLPTRANPRPPVRLALVAKPSGLCDGRSLRQPVPVMQARCRSFFCLWGHAANQPPPVTAVQ